MLQSSGEGHHGVLWSQLGNKNIIRLLCVRASVCLSLIWIFF